MPQYCMACPQSEIRLVLPSIGARARLIFGVCDGVQPPPSDFVPFACVDRRKSRHYIVGASKASNSNLLNGGTTYCACSRAPRSRARIRKQYTAAAVVVIIGTVPAQAFAVSAPLEYTRAENKFSDNWRNHNSPQNSTITITRNVTAIITTTTKIIN